MGINALNISVTGIKAAQQMASAISQNIANYNTAGYRRVDVITSEMNFSGPNGIPFLPAGVKTGIESPDQPWLDGRLNLAVSQDVQANTYLNTLNDYASSSNTSSLESSFSELMASSQEAFMNPTNSAVLERFRANLNGFVFNINQFRSQTENSLNRFEQQINSINQELSGTDPTSQRGIELQAQLNGLNNAINGPITENLESINNTVNSAIEDVNNKFGKEILRVDENGNVIAEFKTDGSFENLTEYSSQQFNTDLGAAKSTLGVAMRDAENSRQFTQSELEGATAAWYDVYGVDLTEEAIKLREVEIYQQANALVARTASEMMGTLLDAFS